jgi:hypothetical protein
MKIIIIIIMIIIMKIYSILFIIKLILTCFYVNKYELDILLLIQTLKK